MGRKILLVTTDQQRYDTLGVNGGVIARTPVVDGLASQGFRYERAVPQSVVCMPSRSTILTGQHPSTHGVWMNGVPLPLDAPSVAALLRENGYRTALIGKAHFEPFLDPFTRFTENALAATGTVPSGGEHRGFEHLELATHGSAGQLHYARWLRANHPEAAAMFYPALDADLEVNSAGGGETGAPQVHVNHVPRGWYHTDWVADHTIAWLDSLRSGDDWFAWMSFPDPHHPWDPPQSEMSRVDWRQVPLPVGYPVDRSEREAILDAKPRHWKMWYEGRLVSNFEAPPKWVPATLTTDQVREVNARNAVECELIDEAVGRVMDAIAARGWEHDVDVIFTTDHGEFQGDFGLLFKGPYHVESLMRLPLIWRPALSSRPTPGVVSTPVGLVDLAPTIASIAGIDRAGWMQGSVLAKPSETTHEGVLTEWDSELYGVDVHLRTVSTSEWVCTAYKPGTLYDGSEGELYNLAEDPLQRVNLWDDPARRADRDDLLSLLGELRPPERRPRLDLEAPV